jgi:cobalamin synthase
MNDDVKGCLTVVAVIVVFILAGNLLTSMIERAGNVIAWLIRAAIFIPFIGFVIVCIRGMKKEEEEDD